LIPAAAVLCISVVMLGVASWRTGRWHGSDAALLIGGLILAWGLLFVVPLRLLDDYVTFFVFFASTWLAIGHALVHPARRASRAGNDARPA
jgi:cell division protein FtsW (lipid II flippase)